MSLKRGRVRFTVVQSSLFQSGDLNAADNDACRHCSMKEGVV